MFTHIAKGFAAALMLTLVAERISKTDVEFSGAH